MTICNNANHNRCKVSNYEHQPDATFRNSKGRKCKTCKTCRDFHAAYKRSLRSVDKADVIGDEPKFEAASDREMWRKHLIGLVREVRN